MTVIARRRSQAVAAGALAALFHLLAAGATAPYPLDGRERTGIRRLEGYLLAQQDPARKVAKLPPGALLPLSEVRLHLAGTTSASWDLGPERKDAVLQAALESIFAARDPSYAVAVIDLTDPERIAWAGLREDHPSLPGSVGKLGVLVALFDGLCRAFPEVETRARILRETVVEAGPWAFPDSHSVPRFDPAAGRNRFAPIARGERFTLAEWVDHMVSASANSAGSTVWKEAMLLRQFGRDYPVDAAREAAFFRDTPKPKLQELALAVIEEPLAASGIDLRGFRQGTMFTAGGAARVPGTKSYATPRELSRLLLRLEQGRLVDAWSSLEMKRYLYMTKRRYRYACAPELARHAIYFKSGSLYRCGPEPGFTCGKYRGNLENQMNSVAMVETEASPGSPARRYLVALTSNVLRKNSAWDHSRLAAAIDQAVRTRKPVEVREEGTAQAITEAGKSD